MTVAVGLSGGVDSAVAALLLRERGHEVVGVTMSLGRADEARSLAEARTVAARIGIPLRVFDFAADWRVNVLDYVRTTYLAGATPNPCVRCNETVKFGLLPQAALALGCDRFATGHYARLVPGPGQRMRLFRAVDRAKDQSYFLYRVKPEVLSRTLFPLGGLTKDEVRAKARDFGLEIADKGDSQDFCGGDPRDLLGTGPREGAIVTRDGRVLGRHGGYWNYTIGQRKGLGVGGGSPYYVVDLRPGANEVVVAHRDESLAYGLELDDAVGLVDRTLPVKVRSAGEPRLLADGIAGVAPGQSAVFYRGDEVVGGGVIRRGVR